MGGHVPALHSCLSATARYWWVGHPGAQAFSPLCWSLALPWAWACWPGTQKRVCALANKSHPGCVGDTPVGFGEGEAGRDLGPQHCFLSFPPPYPGLPCGVWETGWVSHSVTCYPGRGRLEGRGKSECLLQLKASISLALWPHSSPACLQETAAGRV